MSSTTTSPRRWWATAAIVAAAAVAAVAAFAATRAGGSQPPPPPPPALGGRFIVVDADSNGMVFEDNVAHVVVGITSSGAQAWSMPENGRAVALGSCLAACPDVVLSSSVATISRPEVPDPPILWRTADRVVPEVAGIRGHGPGKSLVFAATSSETAVIGEADERGGAQLELRAAHAAPLDVSLPQLRVFVATDEALTHALAIVRQPGQTISTLMWFQRTARGWSRLPNTTLAADDACIGSDASTVVVGSRAGVSMLAFGGSGPVRQVEGVSHLTDCRFDSVGPVIEAGSLQARGATTVVEQLTAAGAVVWRATVADAATLATAPSATIVGVTGGGRLRIFDRHGHPVLSRDHVDGVDVIDDHRLLMLSDTGRVTPVSVQ